METETITSRFNGYPSQADGSVQGVMIVPAIGEIKQPSVSEKGCVMWAVFKLTLAGKVQLIHNGTINLFAILTMKHLLLVVEVRLHVRAKVWHLHVHIPLVTLWNTFLAFTALVNVI
jgi:hypothetical protein